MAESGGSRLAGALRWLAARVRPGDPARRDGPAIEDRANWTNGLQSRDPRVRYHAVRKLCDLPDPDALLLLIDALRDPADMVRLGAVEALDVLGDLRAVEPLIERLEDHNVAVRAAAAVALGGLRDPSAADPLRNALADADAGVQGYVENALFQITYHALRERIDGPATGPPVLDPVFAALCDRANAVRQAATRVLGEIRDPDVVGYLLVALDDESSIVRAIAARALGDREDARAVQPLRRALARETGDVRYSVFKALSHVATYIQYHLVQVVCDTRLPPRERLDAILFALSTTRPPRRFEACVQAVRACCAEMIADLGLEEEARAEAAALLALLDAETLLRPSSALPEAALVRPAGATETPFEQLLRPLGPEEP